MQIQHSRLCLPWVRHSFPVLFCLYFCPPVAFLHTCMGRNQEKRARGGHFPPSVAVCGYCLQCSGSREWATELNSSTASPCLWPFPWIYSRLYTFGGLDMTLPGDKGCEAAWALNDPILKLQRDTLDDYRNHPVTCFGKGIERNVSEVCFCWK